MTIEKVRDYVENITKVKWGIYHESIYTHSYLFSINELMKLLADNSIRYDFEINSKSSFDIYTLIIKMEDIIPFIRNNKLNEILEL